MRVPSGPEAVAFGPAPGSVSVMAIFGSARMIREKKLMPGKSQSGKLSVLPSAGRTLLLSAQGL